MGIFPFKYPISRLYLQHKCFVCVDSLRSSQKFYSHARAFSFLPGLNQYLAENEVSCSRTQHSASSESQT